jgi:aryl-alcohol dehydrogenase-like predicted oxidoreductase
MRLRDSSSHTITGLTTFSPLKMGLLSGKYNGAVNGPPPLSRFFESKDKFAEFMRGNYGNDEMEEQCDQGGEAQGKIQS